MSAVAPKLRVVFFGSPAFAVPSLEAIARHHDVVCVVTQPDRPAGRGKKLAPPAVKDVAQRLGIAAVEQPTTLKTGDLGERLRALAPDLFVVVAYGRILPQALLDVPPLGPWNVHASLLPKYRGAAPIQWAVINGEPVTGVCIMRMEAGLDTGPVAARAQVTIGDTETAGALAERLALVGAELLVATLPRIADGSARPAAQDHAHATVAPMLTKEHGVLDFSQPAVSVAARARGVDPWPGATTLLGDETVKLFTPLVAPGHAPPGTVLGLGPAGLAIACGEGAVAFGELQLPGRRRLPAAAVLAGNPIPPGTRLGVPAGD